MNREIKFKYWDPFNREMKFCSMEYKDYLSKFFIEHDASLQGQNNPILMQFTGIKDKNGIEIYEEDIVLVDRRNSPIPYGVPIPEFKGYIKYSIQAAQYWIMSKRKEEKKERYTELHNGGQYGDENGIRLTGITVIGNMYENQILLK